MREVVEAVVIVKVELFCFPLGFTAFGEKVQVATTGRPLQLSVTLLEKVPPTDIAATT